MKINTLLGELLAEQSPEGAFLSIVHFKSDSYPDRNTFTTAQVLRALHDVPIFTEVPGIKEAVEHAITYLVLSESPERPGHFGFWPAQGCPSWMPSTLTEDADDTAIITLELAKYGHIDIQTLRRIVFKVLMPHRLLSIEQPAPPWLRPGVFLTWLRQDHRPNVIDCCVNANVVALLAYAGLQHLPGFQEACMMINEGIRWAGQSQIRIQSLIPFYPHPIELCYAIEHAIQCGAEPLTTSFALLRALSWLKEDETTVNERPICGSAYGKIVWTSRAVQVARELAQCGVWGVTEQKSRLSSEEPS